MKWIRLFNGEGLFSFDHLIRLAGNFLKQEEIKSNTGLRIVDELYFELVKRGEIKRIEELDKPLRLKIWLEAKRTGELDRGKLVMICHAAYLKSIL
jgi:hypothetical protein